MRIWIFNHYADPPDGLATRSHDIARRLIEDDHPTTIFVSNFSHYRFAPSRKLGPRLWRHENIDGVRYVWIRTTPYRTNDARRMLNMGSFAVIALLAAAMERPGPHVVIGVTVHPLAALAGYAASALRRARFWLEVTDLWPETLIQLGRISRGSFVARAMGVLERFLFDRAEGIVMLWRNTGDYVASVGGDPKKIVWIPHGIELERYAQIPTYDGGRPPYVVMFLGGLVATNALETILDAACVLQQRARTDITFVLQGAGTERDQLRARAAQLELRNVEFRDAVPKRAIASAMVNADAFIYGLRDLDLYRFGISLNKLTDYLAAGRPILFYGRSSYDPVAESAAGLSVPPADPEALADAVERLFSLPASERVAMGARAREHAEREYNIPRLAERLIRVLEAGGRGA